MDYDTVFSTPFFQIEASSDRLADERGIPFYRMTGPDSVICCAMTKLGEFILVRQHRPNIGCATLEFPAGGISINEQPANAAIREFAEETGMVCEFSPLGAFRLMMNRTNIREHIYFGIGPIAAPLIEKEPSTEVVVLERSNFIDYCLTGRYQQLAGLGVVQLVSNYLGLDVLREPMGEICREFTRRKDYECA